MIGVALSLMIGFAVQVAPKPPSVDQILARSKKLYESSHTYQGTLTVTGNLGTKFSQVIEVKCEVGKNGIVKRSRMSTTGSGPRALSRPVKTLLVDNGTTSVTIDVAGKTYGRTPHVEESVFSLLAGIGKNFAGESAKVSVIGTSLDPVYLIKKKLPLGIAELRISKLTGQFIEVRTTGKVNDSSFEIKVLINHQLFNAQIAADAFEWTPSKDFKETPSTTGPPGPSPRH